MILATVRNTRISAIVKAATPPAAPDGYIYDEATGAVLYDEITGAILTL